MNFQKLISKPFLLPKATCSRGIQRFCWRFAGIFVKLRYSLWDILNQSRQCATTICLRKSKSLEKTTYWQSNVLFMFWKMAAISEVLHAARSNNTNILKLNV